MSVSTIKVSQKFKFGTGKSIKANEERIYRQLMLYTVHIVHNLLKVNFSNPSQSHEDVMEACEDVWIVVDHTGR